MATNDFKPFAIGSGANVTAQADWEALAALATGFQSGVAKSAQVNKALRQGSVMAYLLGQFIADQAEVDAADNGDTATLLTNFVAALKAANESAGFLNKSNNLSDLASIPTALLNLGLGDIVLAGVCTGVLDDAGHIDIPMVINGEKKKLIIQWGSTSTTTSGATVTLPTTFPTKYCAGVGCEAGSYSSIKVVAVIPLSLSTIGVYGRAAGTSTLANTTVKWIVIGY